MLTIRRPQMVALAGEHWDAFLELALPALGRVFPADARLGDEQAVRQMIGNASGDAEQYGISGVRELLLYVFLVFEHGRDFEKQEHQTWIGCILRDHTLGEREKMTVIYQRLALQTGAVS